MNIYIKNILEEPNNTLRMKKVQRTITHLIKQYIKEDKGTSSSSTTLNSIKEISKYFSEQKINFSHNDDVFLRILSLNGETEFIEWLLTEANSKKIPDLHIHLSSPLRFACMENHTSLVTFLLTNSQIKRSQINEVNGSPLQLCIENTNIFLIKLFLKQPDLKIEMEHIRAIFKLNSSLQSEILNFIKDLPVKEQFFETMFQYRNEMKDKLLELIANDFFNTDDTFKKRVIFDKDLIQIILKKELSNKLEQSLSENQNTIKKHKI